MGNPSSRYPAVSFAAGMLAFLLIRNKDFVTYDQP
jgi:hypothetical protein